MVRVINNQVTQTSLPTTGTVNGQTVSNYHLLPESTLLSEGCLPLVENKPTLGEGEYHVFAYYTIQETQVVANYTAETIPAEAPSVETRVEIVESTLGEILENIIPNL